MHVLQQAPYRADSRGFTVTRNLLPDAVGNLKNDNVKFITRLRFSLPVSSAATDLHVDDCGRTRRGNGSSFRRFRHDRQPVQSPLLPIQGRQSRYQTGNDVDFKRR